MPGNSKGKLERRKVKPGFIEEKPEKNKRLNFKHVDFISDEEEFTLTSSSWEGSDDTESDISNNDRREKKQKKNKNSKRQGKESKKRSRKINKKKTDHLASNKDESDSEQQKRTEENNRENESYADFRKRTKRINKDKERSNLRKAGRVCLKNWKSS
ncbi:unnamed protein product [Parnassius apollo]|uniref:(apollo) hypothetical protein n=1 Tax=Parnassius apollo TaxID=110799 RepID=A0A8S3X407_PARAO|nr:unnamed protein product [Parnassius apollo]